METATPAQAQSDRLRDEVRAAVKEIIASIKLIDEGPESIPDDARLFSDGGSEPSPLEMDSLDALDLALALKERFDPEGERFEEFLNGEMDPQELGTVRKITDFVMSLTVDSDFDGPASTRKEPGEIQTSVRLSE
jgi:acyl carrier protein